MACQVPRQNSSSIHLFTKSGHEPFIGSNDNKYVSNIFSKLQVTDRAQAIIRARDAGLE